ncbi:MAG TPA: hypothetical protein VFW87_13005, partial [Pirellulales bacterium]|nr:hypothetical protein [Pirellulales bacterium]
MFRSLNPLTWLSVGLALLLPPQASLADEAANASAPELVTFTTQQDHQDMMRQLGITALRPGPSGNPSAPNHANYDESQANPYPDLPDALTLNDGQPVTTPELWWNRRRGEIVEDFEREVYGRVPQNVPGVTWKLVETRETEVGGVPVVEK